MRMIKRFGGVCIYIIHPKLKSFNEFSNNIELVYNNEIMIYKNNNVIPRAFFVY